MRAAHLEPGFLKGLVNSERGKSGNCRLDSLGKRLIPRRENPIGSCFNYLRNRDVVNFRAVTAIHPQQETERGVFIVHRLPGTERRQNGVAVLITPAGLLMESEAPLRQHLARRGLCTGQALECGTKLDHTAVGLRDHAGGFVDGGDGRG